MANKYCNLDGSKKIKDEYQKINIGFDKVEEDVNKINDDINALDERVDTIITTPIDGEAAAQELVDARGGRSTLGQRLDEYDAHLADITTNIGDFFQGNPIHGLWEEVLQRGVNVKWFGAVGDDSTDNTQAFQDAIDYCFENDNILFVPSGVYRIYGTLELPESLKIVGTNENPLGYTTSLSKNCHIKTYAKEVFVMKENTSSVTMSMEGLFFQGMDSFENGTTDGTEDSFVFKNIRFRGSEIKNNTFFHYGTVFYGELSLVSFVHHNHFLGIRRFVFDGEYVTNAQGATIVDSYVDYNYINGRPLTNATCFRLASVAMSSVSHNFIDFFKYIFDFTLHQEGFTISNNIFDYSYRVISNYNKRGLSNLIVVNNTFRSISKSEALGYFLHPDDDMVNGDWMCIDARGLNRTLIANNYVILCDEFMRIREYPTYDLKVVNTTYNRTPKKVEMTVERSLDENDLKNILIDDFNGVRHDTLPDPRQSGATIRTFDKQMIYYQGKLIYNDNGTWRDMMGNAVN